MNLRPKGFGEKNCPHAPGVQARYWRDVLGAEPLETSRYELEDGSIPPTATILRPSGLEWQTTSIVHIPHEPPTKGVWGKELSPCSRGTGPLLAGRPRGRAPGNEQIRVGGRFDSSHRYQVKSTVLSRSPGIILY